MFEMTSGKNGKKSCYLPILLFVLPFVKDFFILCFTADQAEGTNAHTTAHAFRQKVEKSKVKALRDLAAVKSNETVKSVKVTITMQKPKPGKAKPKS